MQVAPGIHRFDTGDFNWYVVEAEGRLTVVDGGWPGHYDALMRGLGELDKTIDDIDAVILTHAHADHTGFVERLRVAAGVEVWVHEADHAMVLKRGQLPWFALLSNAWRRQTFSMLFDATRQGVFLLPRVKAARSFADGQTLDVPGRPTVIHTPGHTPGEVCFHFPERQALICGDTLITLNLLTGEAGPPQLAFDALNQDADVSRRSLARLDDAFRDADEVTLLTGHGPPWTGDLSAALASI